MAEMNIEEAAAKMSSELFAAEPDNEVVDVDEGVSQEAADGDSQEQTDKTATSQPTAQVTSQPTAPVKEAAPTVKPAPKSWAKEYHEHWPKLDPKVQEYIELREKQMLDGLGQYKEHSDLGKQIKDVVTPYKAFLQAQGIDEVKAVQYLMNAHYRLTQGTPEQRQAAYKQLGASLGVVQAEAENTDPNIRALKDQIASLEQRLNIGQQASFNETRSKVAKEVESFAKEHPYFDEISDEISVFVKNGLELSDAYEKAVWANPVTRQKEIARLQTETEKSLKEKSGKEVADAKKASSTVVRTRDTSRTPTENRGKLFGQEHEQEMRSIIKGERAH